MLTCVISPDDCDGPPFIIKAHSSGKICHPQIWINYTLKKCHIHSEANSFITTLFWTISYQCQTHISGGYS